jgi:ABC-type transport system involved in cytochrome bd biosynthesis fused ATPase/permease subunit
MHTQPTSVEPLALADKLLNQAAGSTTGEAAIIVLVEAVGGQLLNSLTLLGQNDTMAEVDWPATRLATGPLSGGERRLLTLADSLASGHPIDLADTLTGLDTWNSQVVVDAIAHATGIHAWGYDR